jgi:uncharacterized protein
MPSTWRGSGGASPVEQIDRWHAIMDEDMAPYYLDRLDEHWENRAEVEMPLLKKKPSDTVRQSKMYFCVEPGESQLAHTIDYVDADHFLYASDIPHWDNEFPENLHDLREHKELSNETKEKILYKNGKALFAL